MQLLGCDSSSRRLFTNIHTLRLTKYGYSVFKRQYDHWDFESPGTSANNMIILHRVMTYPYYIDKDNLILFTERDAFIARLGGPQNWLNGKKDEN